ncbi:hypothetical protein [Sphingomonas sp. PP-F2F-G114-C0414]|uniref:hypothetical protein n=1 Tax=Sphingomonas sp. PP-F2F-G114-C0414 TaxID=2135662 RepID=UPI0011C366CC|nr:hypothetical protein [Sphingomonas sp. PP-F2F-G114-C0414]
MPPDINQQQRVECNVTDLLSVPPPAVTSSAGTMLGRETGTVTVEFKRCDHTADQVAELGKGNVLRVSQAAIDARKPGA